MPKGHRSDRSEDSKDATIRSLRGEIAELKREIELLHAANRTRFWELRERGLADWIDYR